MGAVQGWVVLGDEGVTAPAATGGKGGRERPHRYVELGCVLDYMGIWEHTEDLALLLLPRVP